MAVTLEILTPAEQAELHERSLAVLATVGMRVDSDEGRRILKDAGALVDDATRIVRFPAALVAESLAAAPRQFALGGRRPGWSHPLNAGESTLCDDGGGVLTVDRQTRELRRSTAADWFEAASLCDALEEIGMLWSPTEHHMEAEGLAGELDHQIDLLRVFSRHIQNSFTTAAEVRFNLRAQEIVFGGRDEIRRLHPSSFLVTPVSPLVLDAVGIDAWLLQRGYDIPLAVMPMPLMGTTAPASMLSMTLLANCEVLGTLCLAQAADPGLPVIYAPLSASIDPRSGMLCNSAAHGAVNVALIEMGRFYGLPVEGTGQQTDALVPGAQSALEHTFAGFFSALAWPDILVGPGSLGESTVFSCEQLVIDVEAWRMACKAREGIRFEAGEWLTDVIEHVGHGGQYLSEKSTRRLAHGDEWFRPQLGWREAPDAWAAAGRPDYIDQASARVDELLAARRPLPLGDDVEKALAELRDAVLRESAG
jgi:trimethylamine--corrinoid protein Co-methyltransferase